jgi:hypothetical protein
MRLSILTLMTGLLVACGDDNPTDPPVQDPNRLRVINGPATCSGCGSVDLTVAGPDLDKVIEVTILQHATQLVITSTTEIRHFVGDSGLVLQLKVTFLDSVPAGEYDLQLEAPGRSGSLKILGAVKLTSAFGGPGEPPQPPPPPGPTGVVRVTATSSGPRPPGDFLATVTPCDPVYVCPGKPVSPGGRVSIPLNPGTYTISLAQVPTSCTVAQPTAVAVTVVANQTVDVSFSVTCTTPATGTLRVSAPTTGFRSTAPYAAGVSPCDFIHACSTSVSPGGTALMQLNTGTYTVTLDAIPSGCTVAGSRSQQVTIGQGQTVDVTFSVTCPPAGTVHVTASVTGGDPDNSFFVTEGECDYYYYDCTSVPITVGYSVDFTLAPGNHSIGLSGIEGNCTVAGANPRSVMVVSNVRTDVNFAVTCVATGRIRVSVSTTGPDPDAGYQVTIGACNVWPCTLSADANGFVEFDRVPGTYFVQLSDVASNCSVSAPNPASVTATAGTTTNVAFAVTCTALPPPPPTGVVRVTAPTTGTNRDLAYNVVNESSCDFYYGCTQLSLAASGAVEFTAVAGSQVFRLTDIAANCTVTGANPATVTVVGNATTELAFPVTCH